MSRPSRFRLLAILLAMAILPLCIRAETTSPSKEIPGPLRGWEQWATWDDADRVCPTPYRDPDKPLCFWPSRLTLEIEPTVGRFELEVTVFSESWVPLPGDGTAWPYEVKANGVVQPIVEHDERPSVKLPAGVFRLEGNYRWSEVPAKLAIPKEIGMLVLTLQGAVVESPAWDAEGNLWLRRDGAAEQAEADFLGIKVYAVLEDGIPLWLRSEIELSVSGKNREEQIGSILPEGWKLAAVDSPIPVAVDDAGQMKAQVRPGKWIVHLDAFRLDNAKEIRYAPDARPAVAEELIGFRANPELRMVEILGALPRRRLTNDFSRAMAGPARLPLANFVAAAHRRADARNGHSEAGRLKDQPFAVAG